MIQTSIAHNTDGNLGECPKMHCHAELLKDLNYQGFIPNETMMRWFNDRYSTSKHLLTLYSIARGLNARNIVEIGFGRSSFVLAKAAHENYGKFITCDSRNFSYLLSDGEKSVSTFINGDAEQVWGQCKEGIDFAFLDFFSISTISKDFSLHHILKCLYLMKQNAVLALHDSIDDCFQLKQTLKDLVKETSKRNLGIEIINLPYNYGLGIIRKISISEYGEIKDEHFKKP